MSQNSVLIIDYESNLRQLLGRVLELESYTVLMVANAYRGLELLRGHTL